MYAGKLVFAQLTDLIHPEQFRRCVRRYAGDYKIKTFSCWNQFLCMAFGQLTFRESLRDVETCLRSRAQQLYHLGLRGEVSRSVLADANRERDWRIYHDLAQLLTGVRSDQIIWLRNPSSIQHFPDKLRRIHYVDGATGNRLIFLTNHLTLPAFTMARLYKGRWQVELFFKWIKQHLRIKHFYGTSDNAVKTQIWIAICVYVLVAIIKKQLASERSLYNILQVLSVNIFQQVPLQQLLEDSAPQSQDDGLCNQLIFNY